MTKAQREYTEQVITVEQSPAQRRASSFSWTVYHVTFNPLMATRRRRIVGIQKCYRDAALMAEGYAKAAGVKLSSLVDVN